MTHIPAYSTRLWVLVALRVAALVWVVLSVGSLARWLGLILTVARSGDMAMTNFVELQGVSITAAALRDVLILLVLVVRSRRLADWIVPTGRLCSWCCYPLDDIRGTVCPECGRSDDANSGGANEVGSTQ